MKRISKPFVVEHKRRLRQNANDVPSIWTGTAAGELRQELALLDLTYEAADAFAVDRPSVDPEHSRTTLPGPARTGRILDTIDKPQVEVVKVEADGQDKTVPTLIKATVGRHRTKRHQETQLQDEAERVAPFARDQKECFRPSDEDRPLADMSAPRRSYRRLRQAATGGLPVGERWKWGLS